jgi:hypothetical protein
MGASLYAETSTVGAGVGVSSAATIAGEVAVGGSVGSTTSVAVGVARAQLVMIIARMTRAINRLYIFLIFSFPPF